MDLVKAQKVLRKNFKDHGVKSSIDEETLLMFICVDLVREDMANEATTPPRPAANRNRRNDAPGQMSLVDSNG